ncbi:MAG: hypothetical protein NVS1B6_00210 [Steroidobacteraceae bacterium]
MILTESQRNTIIHDLRIAADVFDKNIAFCNALEQPMSERLADQFKRQSAESRALAETIEQAESVTVILEDVSQCET